MGPIISIINLKNGVGTSTLTWNMAHILGLDIYQHDKAIHHLFLDERNNYIEEGMVQSKSVSVYPIDKRQFKSGVYDLGADINYGYVRQILSRSDVIVIPAELGAEVVVKTIATIKYVAENNTHCDIYVAFNKLDNSDPVRERKYTEEAEDKIKGLDKPIASRIHFHYIRYAFAMFRNLGEGYCFLDNFLRSNTLKVDINNFELLQHLRYYTLGKMSKSKRQREKIEREKEKSDFYDKHTSFYEDFKARIEPSELFDANFVANNTKIIKDMLILSTHIKGVYSRTWERTDNE